MGSNPTVTLPQNGENKRKQRGKTMNNENETYNDLEIRILIQDWIEEEPDEYWNAIEAI